MSSGALNPVELLLGILRTKEEKIAAAKAVVYRTSYGRGNVLQVDYDDAADKVIYRIPALGERTYDNFHQAIAQLNSRGINDYTVFTPDNNFGIRFGDPYNQAREMYRTIYQRAQILSDAQKDMLRRAGINPDTLDNLVLELITMKDKDEGGKVIGALDLLRDESPIKGASMISDDGARILNFKMGDVSLTSYQVSFLRNMFSQPELNPETFGNIIGRKIDPDTGVPIGTDPKSIENLINKLAKVGKRNKGFFAPREIGLVGDLLDSFLSKELVTEGGSPYRIGTLGLEINTPGETIPLVSKSGSEFIKSQNILVLDNAADILAKYAGVNFMDIEESIEFIDSSGRVRRRSAVAESKDFIYGKNVRKSFLGEVLDRRRGVTQNDEDELKKAIRDFYSSKVNDKFDEIQPGYGKRSKMLKDYLKTNFAGSDSARLNLIEEIFDTIDFAYDGAALGNEHNIRVGLRGGLQSFLDDLINGTVSVPDQERAVGQIRSVIDLIDSNELAQVTTRGFLENLGLPKTATAFKEFPSFLKNLAMIIGDVDLKDEVVNMGSNAIAFSGIGDASKRVYLNAMQAAFHADIFIDDQSIENMVRLSQKKLLEVQQAIAMNQLPDSMIKYLEETTRVDISYLPFEQQESALRNRKYAQDILDLHRRGAAISDHPELMNMLHRFMQTEAFRYRDGQFQGVVPLTSTFGVASETSVIDASKRVLGKGARTIDTLDAAGMPVQTEIIDFRISKGQLMFAPQMTAQVRHALGGYDFDDKIQLSTKIFRDKDKNRRLGFYVTRTPSGYQESVFVRNVLDAESVRYLFGHDEYFIEQLEAIVKAGGVSGVGDDIANQLLDAVRGRSRRATKGGWNADNIEQAIIRVYDEMWAKGMYKPGEISAQQLGLLQRFGSTPLRVNPLDYPMGGGIPFTSVRPGYMSVTGEGLNPLASKLYTVATVNDADRINMSTLLDEILENNPEIPDEIRTALTRSASGSTFDLERRLSVLGDLMRQSGAYGIADTVDVNLMKERAAHAGAILEKLYEKAMLKSAESGDILGVYINRTMLAGNILGRYEHAYNSIGNTVVQDYIRNNLDFGLLEYEEAIDLSNYFSGSRELDIEKISKETGVPIDRLQRLYDRITSIDPDNTKIGFLNRAGQDTINQLGRVIGFMRASGETEFGIDDYFIEGRLNKNDARQIADKIISGINEYERVTGSAAAGPAVELRDTLNSMISEGKGPDEIFDFLRTNISYESGRVTKMVRASEYIEAQFINSLKTGLRSMSDSDIIKNATKDEKSLNIARRILADHESLFKFFEDITTESFANLTEQQKGEQYARALRLGQSIYGQINEAIKIDGVNLEKLFNSFNYLNRGKPQRDMANLRFLLENPVIGVGPEYSRLNELAKFANTLARHEYYLKGFDTSVADELIDRMRTVEIAVPDPRDTNKILRVQVKLDIDESNLKAFAIDKLKQGGVNVDSLEEAVYKTLAGQMVETDDELFLADVKREAEIIRARIFENSLDPASSTFDPDRADKVSELRRAGVVTTADDDDLLLRRLISAADGSAPTPRPRTPYSRLNTARLRSLFDNKLAKGGAIGLSALVLGSLAYSKIRDVTHDSVAGPPLLPGGSAYEKGVNSQPIVSSDFQNQPTMTGYSPGVSYKINLSGSQELVQKFNREASALFNGTFNTTIYNGMPRVDRDPYVEMGRIF